MNGPLIKSQYIYILIEVGRLQLYKRSLISPSLVVSISAFAWPSLDKKQGSTN